MAQLAQVKLQGLAPNRTSFDGQAFRAENVDLSGGGARPVKAPSFVEPGHSGAIAFHDGAWVSGEEFYIPTDIRGIPALIFKTTGGQWKITMNNVVSGDLWIEAPTDLTVEPCTLPTPSAALVDELGSGDILAGAYEYFTRLIQEDSNGETIRTSLFSASSEITVSTGRVRLTRPSVSNTLSRTSWQVFRRSVGATYANLVGSAPMGTAFIYDSVENSFLGETAYPEATKATAIDYRYVVAWVRNFGGWEHESVPSEVVATSQRASGVKLTLTQTPPKGVTSWRIYRLSLGADPTTTFQLVADIAAGTTEYIDIKPSVELGDALQSSYRADNGALVTAGVPAGQFTGMAGPFNGFYVGWIGRDLYLSQPGNPAWWPGAFVVEANFNIVGVSQVGGNLAVVTEGGVQFGYGVSPDAFALSQSVFGPGGANPLAISKDVYLGHSGIYAVSDQGVQELSTDFGRSYFDDLTLVGMIYDLDTIILFHSAGALMYNKGNGQWTTLSQRDHAFTAVHAVGGYTYGLRNGSIVKLFGSDDDTTMDYESTASFNESFTKRVEAVRVRGTGSVHVELKAIEDTSTILASGDLDLDSEYWPDKTVYTPAWVDTEALRYRISGKATVRAILFEVDKGSTES